MSGKPWLPAQDLPAERALLGGVMLNNNAFDDVSDVVAPEHFYDSSNERIYTAISGLLRQGINVDAITLASDLIQRGWFEKCGGGLYLAELLETVPHSVHSLRYAKMVRAKADERNARYALTEAVASLDDGRDDLQNIIHKVDGTLLKLLESSIGTTDIHVAGAVADTLKEIERRISSDSDVSGVASGFIDLDKLTTGFHPASLILLAARPSMGKTAFVSNVAVNIARRNQHVLFCSLEQTKCEIVERLVAGIGQVDAHSLRTGRLNRQEQIQVQDAGAMIANLPLHIDDRPDQTLQQIRAVARRTQRKHGLSVIIVDYLQIIWPENRNAQREQQVAELSRGLKALAKELNVPVIALAQLNRGVEGREDKRPRLADLRESGSLEQDADVVMFLHRPDKYDAADRPGVAELIVSKNRNGMTDIVQIRWQGKWMRFVDAEPQVDGFNL